MYIKASNLMVVGVVALIALMMAGCADVNIAEGNAALCARELSGFWLGLWHGIVAPVAFFGSLFEEGIAVYDVCNNGAWYDLGFCLGVGAFTSGSHTAVSRSPWPRRSEEHDRCV